MQCPTCQIEIPSDTEVCKCGHHFIYNVSQAASGQIDQKPSILDEKAPNPIAILAVLEALRCQQENLHQTIASLVALLKTLPEGEGRDELLVAISSLDAISGNLKRALDLCD
jgi:hypothetical protein